MRPGQLGQRLERRVAARGLVDLDDRVALAALDGDGDDLLGQAALVGGGDRALVRAQRPAVHVGARHLELVADLGRLVGHVLAAERVREPVVDHRVERLDVAHAEAEARAAGACRARWTSTPCRRRRATSTSPARIAWSSTPTARMPEAQTLLIVSEETSFGIPASIWAWREGIWPCPACSTWPMTTCCDLLGRDVGALERGPDRDAAELGGLQGGQAAAELADGGAGGAEDHGLGHGTVTSSLRRRCESGPPPTPRPTPAPTRSSSASSRARAIAARRRRAARCRRWWTSGEARRRVPQARASPTPPAGAGCWSASARATTSTPSAPGSPPRPSLGRARELGTAHAVLGAAAQGRRRRRRRARRGHAARRVPLHARSRASRRRRTAARARWSSPPTTTSPAAVDGAPRRRRGRQRARATSRTRPANELTPTRARRRARAPTSSRACTVEVMGREEIAPPAWARSPPSRRAPTRSRS